jgi:hypothetical protein
VAIEPLTNLRSTKSSSKFDVPAVWNRVAGALPPPDPCSLTNALRTEAATCVFISLETGDNIDLE